MKKTRTPPESYVKRYLAHARGSQVSYCTGTIQSGRRTIQNKEESGRGKGEVAKQNFMCYCGYLDIYFLESCCVRRWIASLNRFGLENNEQQLRSDHTAWQVFDLRKSAWNSLHCCCRPSISRPPAVLRGLQQDRTGHDGVLIFLPTKPTLAYWMAPPSHVPCLYYRC